MKYAFGPFVLDAATRRLLRDGAPVAITARVFDILAALIRQHGRPVDRNALIEQVWGDLAVEEDNLSRNVSTLRKVLGEMPDDHRFIVTLPGQGYQFVAAVRVLEESAPPDAASPPESSAHPPVQTRVDTQAAADTQTTVETQPAAEAQASSLRGLRPRRGRRARSPLEAAVPPRIVVLPFKNLGAAEQDYVAAGLTEEITSRLAAVHALRVISRTTASHYDLFRKSMREIGADLGADYVLEGSVLWNRQPRQRERDRVRVVAQLIRVAEDAHVWAETYDRGPWDLAARDLLTMEAEMAGDGRGSARHGEPADDPIDAATIVTAGAGTTGVRAVPRR